MKEYRLTPDSNRLEKVDVDVVADSRNLSDTDRKRLKTLVEDALVDLEIIFMCDKEAGVPYLVSTDGHYTHGHINEDGIVVQYYRGEDMIAPVVRRNHFDSYAEYLEGVKKVFNDYADKLHVSDPEAERRESMKTYLNSPVPPREEIRTAPEGNPLKRVSWTDFLDLFTGDIFGKGKVPPTASTASAALSSLGFRVMKDEEFSQYYLVKGERYLQFSPSEQGLTLFLKGERRTAPKLVEFANSGAFTETVTMMFADHYQPAMITRVTPESSPVAQRRGAPTDVEYRLDEDDESPLREFQWNDFRGRYHLEGDSDKSMKMAEIVEEALSVCIIMTQDVNTGIPYLVNYSTGEYVPGMLRPDGIIIGNDFNSKVPVLRFRIKSRTFLKDALEYFKKHAQELVVTKKDGQPESAQEELKSEWHEDENGKWVHPRYPATGQVPHPRMKLSYREDSNDGVLFIDGAEVPLSFGELLDLREKVDKTISYCQRENRALWEEWYQLQTRREADKLGLDGVV